MKEMTNMTYASKYYRGSSITIFFDDKSTFLKERNNENWDALRHPDDDPMTFKRKFLEVGDYKVNPDYLQDFEVIEDGEKVKILFTNGAGVTMRLNYGILPLIQHIVKARWEREHLKPDYDTVFLSEENGDFYAPAEVYLRDKHNNPILYRERGERYKHESQAQAALQIIRQKEEGDHLSLEQETHSLLEAFFIENSGEDLDQALHRATILSHAHAHYYINISPQEEKSWRRVNTGYDPQPGAYTLVVPADAQFDRLTDDDEREEEIREPHKQNLREQLSRLTQSEKKRSL